MMDNEIALKTISALDLQKENKLKGMAFETLIKWTFDKVGVSLNKETNLSIINKRFEEYIKKVYRINKDFNVKLNNKTLKFRRKKDKSNGLLFLDTNLLDSNIKGDVFSVKKEWDGKWFVCNHCGQFIPAKTKKTRKCKKCKRGNFVKHTVKKRYVFNSLNELVSILLSEKYISPVSPVTSKGRLRVDYWRIIDDSLIIYECKNKEKSGLSYRDAIQVLIYGSVLRRSGIRIKHITLVFNGFWEDWFINFMRESFSEYGLELRLIPIKKWLIEFTKRTKIMIKQLVFCKYPIDAVGFEPIRYSENSNWFLNIRSDVSQIDKKIDYSHLDLVIGG